MLFVNIVFGQKDNRRSKKILLNKDTIVFDTLVVIPSSFSIYDNNWNTIDSSLYRLDFIKSQVIFNSKLCLTYDYLIFRYRVSDISCSDAYIDKFKLPKFAKSSFSQKHISQNGTNSLFKNLNAQGIYTRSFSYGNNSGSNLESQLNLQLNGKLSNDISIIGNISDNSTMLQTNANTQNIDEVDNIYVKLFDKNKSLTLGDYQLIQDSMGFIRFNNKLRGIRFTYKSPNNNYSSDISASSSKARFNSQVISANNGIQGPYKLLGKNGEQNIITISGSEKIYLNGKLLKRGLNQDYVIDYNLSEFSFNIKNPINSRSRILVEFEYSDKTYASYSLYSSSFWKSKKFKLQLLAYHKSDSKNDVLDSDINEYDKKIMSQVGDNLSNALSENVREEEFSEDKILYKKDFIVHNNETFTIYKYSQNRDSSRYYVKFRYVGDNQGNYILDEILGIGVVYKWIPPVQGIKQGNYTIFKSLKPPTLHQMYELKTQVKLGNEFKTNIDLALSRLDLNRYSEINDSDNIGTAASIELDKKFTLKDSNNYFFSSIRSSFIKDKFEAISNFRDIEYNRNWNIDEALDQDEFNIELYNNYSFKRGNISYSYQNKDISSYKANKHNALFKLDLNMYKSKVLANILVSEYLDQNTKKEYFETENTIAIHNYSVSHKINYEKNIIKDNFSGIYKLGSLKNIENSFRINRNWRKSNVYIYTDLGRYYLPKMESLVLASEKTEFGAGFKSKGSRTNSLSVDIKSIEEHSKDEQIAKNPSSHNYFIKLKHKYRTENSFISFGNYYKISTEQENKVQYTYIKTEKSKGQYKWIDFNKDEKKDLNEFVLAEFEDLGEYIRVSNISNNFRNLYTVTYRFNNYVRFSRLKVNIFKWLKPLKLRTNYVNEYKFTENNIRTYIDIFSDKLSENGVVEQKNNFNELASYRKSNSKFRYDFSYTLNRSKQNLINDFKINKKRIYDYKISCFANSNLSFVSSFKKTKDQSRYLIDKDFSYKISSYELKSISNYNLYKNLNIEFATLIKKKQEKLLESKLDLYQFDLNLNHKTQEKSKFSLLVSYVGVNTNINGNTVAGNQMLEGFSNGDNFVWNINFLREFGKYIKLDIKYSGRKSEQIDCVHTGQIGISAVF
ncbi:MAG: hypothetical protein N4A49_14195 [Marinifilaceae bacterium]|nr:hypothetical protein [Marinifilaceae bacterium]